jgi:hypothetical protein
MEELIPLEIPVSLQTIRLIKSYAALSGKDTAEVSQVLGEEVSGLLEGRLKSLIAYEVGATPTSEISTVVTTTARTSGYAQVMPKDQLLADGIGDQEPEDIPPSEEQVIPKGGLTMADIDRDMEIEDPSTEAKSEPPNYAEPVGNSYDILAEAVGYIDSRVAKRKKRFGNGRGRVTALNERVLAEGAGT